MSLYSQSQPPPPVRARADETLDVWNEIGNKLIAMARDFPADKYDFKLEKDERTFAQNLLHVAAVDYDLIRSISGSNIGPDFGKDRHNPSRDVYKTKADVVKLIEQAVADGASPVDPRVVLDGNLISAAGVTAGIDAALETTAMLCGDKVARQNSTEYPVRTGTAISCQIAQECASGSVGGAGGRVPRAQRGPPRPSAACRSAARHLCSALAFPWET